MKLSKITKEQAIDILKVALYLGVSAILDYLISLTAGTNQGDLIIIINVMLVAIKKAFTKEA